jgi:hypothetical protein
MEMEEDANLAKSASELPVTAAAGDEEHSAQ